MQKIELDVIPCVRGKLMIDINTLYRNYLSWDSHALENLMEIYGDRLTLYINGYVGNIHDAEDLLIDIFAYLVDRRPDVKNNFNSYIHKAARNHALMFLRKRKRYILFADKEFDFCIADTFEDKVCTGEQNEQLYKCLDRLPPAQKEALYLVYIEKMSYKDAAAVLRRTVRLVDNLLQTVQ